jgi:hypothetical protein
MTGSLTSRWLLALASNYEQKDLHYLTSPLYLQCIAISPHPPSCQTVVLMNNLSASLAQQSEPPKGFSTAPPPSRAQLVTSARKWAEKALEVAAHIKPPARTEDCDQGCAVATHNIGEFLEMEGDLAGARARYEEARGLSKAIGFTDGMKQAQEGIKRIARRESGGST